jgi:hypothetical protein
MGTSNTKLGIIIVSVVGLAESCPCIRILTTNAVLLRELAGLVPVIMMSIIAVVAAALESKMEG